MRLAGNFLVRGLRWEVGVVASPTGASPVDAYTDGGRGDGPYGWLSTPTGPRRQPPEENFRFIMCYSDLAASRF